MERTKLNYPRALLLVFSIWFALSLTTYGTTVTVTNSVHINHGAKLNPGFWLGNADEPVPPADYRPNDKHRTRKWYFRNPTHNLNYYVIGIADKTFRRSGHCPHEVFNPREGWNWAVCKYKFLRLPFVSYRHDRFRFYLGWRERGNFGAEIKFRAASEHEQAHSARITKDLPSDALQRASDYTNSSSISESPRH